MRLKHCMVIIFLILPWQLHALGVDLGLKELYEKHSGAIDSVFLCGSWKGKDQEGVYRVTHAFLYAQSYVYIQQMHFDQDLGSYQSLKDISIAEFNHDHADVSLEDLHCSAVNEGIVLKAKAYYGHENKTRDLEINVSGDRYFINAKDSD